MYYISIQENIIKLTNTKLQRKRSTNVTYKLKLISLLLTLQQLLSKIFISIIIGSRYQRQRGARGPPGRRAPRARLVGPIRRTIGGLFGLVTVTQHSHQVRDDSYDTFSAACRNSMYRNEIFLQYTLAKPFVQWASSLKQRHVSFVPSWWSSHTPFK